MTASVTVPVPTPIRPVVDPTPEQCSALSAYWEAIALIPDQHPATAAFARAEARHWTTIAEAAGRVRGPVCPHCGGRLA